MNVLFSPDFLEALPGFRGATLGGAIVGELVAIVTAYFIWGYRRRGRKLHEAQA